jgi:hypothetical protein
MDDEKPDTRHLVLKPKEIIPMDKLSRPGDGTAISVQMIHRENRLAEEKLARKPKRARGPLAPPLTPALVPGLPAGFKPRQIDTLNPISGPDDEEAIHVPDILNENRAAEDRTGWGRLKRLKKRKSKRNRDFIILVGGIDLVIAAAIKFMPSSVTMIYGLAGITLVTSTFAWIMFVVNDDY